MGYGRFKQKNSPVENPRSHLPAGGLPIYRHRRGGSLKTVSTIHFRFVNQLSPETSCCSDLRLAVIDVFAGYQLGSQFPFPAWNLLEGSGAWSRLGNVGRRKLVSNCSGYKPSHPHGHNPARQPWPNGSFDDCWAVRFWLIAVAGLVFLMVLIWGCDAAHRIGLSITQWKPLQASPLSAAEWRAEFDR